MEHLVFTQKLNITIEKAWDFFSNPHNLQKITPPAMNFRIINKLPDKIYEGMFIEFRVSPLPGIPVEWVTEISHVKAPHFFIDEQRKGPYQIWHHEHHFEEVENGVEMTDKLYYNLSLGFIGKTIGNLVVNKKVHSIFTYREQILKKLFD